MNRKVAAAVPCVAVALAIVGATAAEGQRTPDHAVAGMTSQAPQQGIASPAATRSAPIQPRRLNRQVAAAFAAFRRPRPAGERKDPELLREGQRQAAAEAQGDTGPRLDLARAVPVAVRGSTSRAWIVPAGARVCTLIPDPTGSGAGGGCNTIAEIRRGAAITVVRPAVSGSDAIVAQLVADGGTPAMITSSGHTSPLGSPKDIHATNAVAATVPPDAVIRSGAMVTDLSALTTGP